MRLGRIITGALLAPAAALAALASPAAASATPAEAHHAAPAAWTGPSADLSLVHGVPGLAVDIYVVKDYRSVKELTDVTFGTAADLDTLYPGWVTPGYYIVDVVPTGGNPFFPLLLAQTGLGMGQSKTVAAYVSATKSGTAGAPKLGVFFNDVSSTGGDARVTVRHLAVAPTVGVYADGSVAITPAFSNGQTAKAVVPAGSYDVTVTAPKQPGTVLADAGSVTLKANTNTLAFAIGTYPSTFKVVALVVPTV
jgi:hypothetical protein